MKSTPGAPASGAKINSSYARFAWAVLIYNIAVVLWGAFVRATGSGAGCGSHWPLCNGEVLPRAEQVATQIEFTHRLMSGLALILVIILLVWAFRAYPKGSTVRLGAVLSMVFIITEALVGAGLVLFEWVAMDDSVGRVISMAVHLINTFLLLAVLALTAWWASGGKPVRIKGQGIVLWALGIGFLGIMLLGVTGAMTALGDTLFPAETLREGLQQDLSSAAHFTIRLRIWHPMFAIGIGMYLIFISLLLALFRPERTLRWFAAIFSGLFVIQLAAGLINVVLLAPVWMQIVHLLLADLVWLSLVLLAATTLADGAGLQDVKLNQEVARPSTAPPAPGQIERA